jgi:uncharacterized protein YdaU (DUF1376 family)
MNPSPAFQFYPADFLADENVMMMTPLQRGAYIMLICHAWRSTTVGRLLNDRQRLSSLAGLTLNEWSENEAAILRAFRVDEDGHITQKRLVREWEKQQVRHNQTVAAGKASAEKRRKPSNERPFNDRSTTVERTGNPSSSSSSSSSSSHVPPTPRAGGVKRLNGIPATADEVVAFGSSLRPPVAPDRCRKFFDYYEGQRRENPNGDIFWVTSGEAVITHWQSKLPSFGTNNGGGETLNKPSKPRTLKEIARDAAQ